MKTTRKAICCLLAALMTFLSVPTVIVSAAADSGRISGDAADAAENPWDDLDYQKHPITTERFTRLIQAAEEQIACYNGVTGEKLYPPVMTEMQDALGDAESLAANAQATVNAITLVYHRLYQALIRSKDAHDYLDENGLLAMYSYTDDLIEHHAGCFDAESLQTLRDVNRDAQTGYLYTLTTQPQVNEACADFLERLDKTEALAAGDFIPPKKYAGIYAVVLALLPSEPEWDIYPFIDYTPLPGVYGGYYLVEACSAVEQPLELFMRCGGYIYEADSYADPSDLGYLLVDPDDGSYLCLEDGIRQGVIGGDALYALYRAGRLAFRMRLAGDANDDGALDITDVTGVQKKAAQYAETAGLDVRYLDYNNDGRTDVTDATALQKRIAGMDDAVSVPFTLTMTVAEPSVDTKNNAPYFSEAHLVRSVAELDAVFDGIGDRIDLFHSDIAALRAAFADCDEQYFRTDALILWDCLASGAMDAAAACRVDAVTRSGSTLTVSVTRTEEACPAPISTLYLLGCRVSQAQTDGVAEVQLQQPIVF